MPRIFIRVELHGLASGTWEATYQKLHDFMYAKNWYRSVNARVDGGMVMKGLPTAMYSGTTTANSLLVANTLSGEIATTIWYRNTVLVMTTAEAWGIAGEDI